MSLLWVTARREGLSDLEEGLHSWVGAPSDVSLHLDDLDRGLGPNAQSSITHYNRRAQAVAVNNAVHTAPPTSRVLYRGTGMPTLPEIGDVLHHRLVGYTTSRPVAHGWAKKVDRYTPGRGVIFHLERGARALPIGEHITSGLADAEKEHLTGGRFEVTDVEENGRGGVHHVHLRQVEHVPHVEDPHPHPWRP